MQPIGQHQPALRVRIHNLDGGATHRCHHIAGLHGPSVRHVLRRADHRDHLDRGFQACNGVHSANHRCRPGHVVLHLLHAVSGLDGDPAGVEGDALADETKHRRTVGYASRRLVGHYDECGRLLRSLGHRPEGLHLQLLNLLGRVDLAAQPGFVAHRIGARPQFSGCQDIARLIHQRAGKVLRCGNDQTLG